MEPFSEWRFAHHYFIHLPRTIAGPRPGRADINALRPEWREAAFDHMDDTGYVLPGGAYCGDAIRAFQLGA